jgi:hypothetical protein
MPPPSPSAASFLGGLEGFSPKFSPPAVNCRQFSRIQQRASAQRRLRPDPWPDADKAREQKDHWVDAIKQRCMVQPATQWRRGVGRRLAAWRGVSQACPRTTFALALARALALAQLKLTQKMDL